MREKLLVTGGCGFIGRYVCRAAAERGYDVRVLDSFIDQVHGPKSRGSLSGFVEVIDGDIRDAGAVKKALAGVDAVIHLAAEVGVGQSMYEIERYVDVNDRGSSVLFDTLVRSPVRRVVTASSMSIYGEGLYRNNLGEIVEPTTGSVRRAPDWNPTGCPGDDLQPVATPETKRPALASVYALTKYVQERLTLITCPVYGMEGCALRLFNVFGPGQSLSNPYTGVLAIFASRLANGQPPMIFEDGLQRRDFVHVTDVADAFMLALEKPDAAGGVFNIGSGQDTTVLNVAQCLAHAMGREEISPTVLGKARAGDIRHCYADISLARKKLGFAPARRLDDGTLAELADWVARSRAVDRVDRAKSELERRGLIA